MNHFRSWIKKVEVPIWPWEEIEIVSSTLESESSPDVNWIKKFSDLKNIYKKNVQILDLPVIHMKDKQQDRITAKDPRPTAFSVQKFGGVKEEEEKEEEKKEKKKSISWPMLPQGVWVKICDCNTD